MNTATESLQFVISNMNRLFYHRLLIDVRERSLLDQRVPAGQGAPIRRNR